MRYTLLCLFLVIAAQGAFSAQAKDETLAEKRARLREKWPADKIVERALSQVRYDTANTIEREFRGETVRFIPANFNHIDEEAQKKGMILGKLQSETESKDGLPAGTYAVFIRKEDASWEVYFTQGGTCVAKSKNVLQNQTVVEKPKFQDAGTAIHHGQWIFDW